ncbi:MAG: helix-turn-helix domain-containing protein [Phycisphaerales bacterium]|nr:helix-turn-helix domain-containing protein [Phycisphaerales bacterium]MCB9836224.1 helix-turn-helix domain-containing protein [Phycisphaera sp.]
MDDSGQSGTPYLVDAKEACKLLCMGPRRLWSLTNCNAIPSRKIGRSVRYLPDELRAWIEAGCPTEPDSAEDIREAVRG